MTDQATFSGTYSDLKLIRSRKVAVVCIEIPIEAAAAFVAAFGMPNPAEETWVAIARMKNEVKEPTTTLKRPFDKLPLPQQAALACKREAFQRFVFESPLIEIGAIEISERAAAVFVRHHCKIESRSELARNEIAADNWEELYRDFTLWLNET